MPGCLKVLIALVILLLCGLLAMEQWMIDTYHVQPMGMGARTTVVHAEEPETDALTRLGAPAPGESMVFDTVVPLIDFTWLTLLLFGLKGHQRSKRTGEGVMRATSREISDFLKRAFAFLAVGAVIVGLFWAQSWLSP